MARSWLHTQLTAFIRIPRSKNAIEVLYQKLLKQAGPESLAGFFPDLLLKQQLRDGRDPVVQALTALSSALQKGYVELQRSLFAYLLKDCSEDALAEMSLSENLEHLDDKLFVLAMALQGMIGTKVKIGTGGEVGPASRLYLVLDEMENVLHLSAETCWAFTHALEQLSHDVGGGLTVWLNCKATDAATARQVEKRLGRRLLREWITHTCFA